MLSELMGGTGGSKKKKEKKKNKKEGRGPFVEVGEADVGEQETEDKERSLGFELEERVGKLSFS